MDGYHSNTDGNLTLTHTGTTEFVQLSPAFKKNLFFTRPVDVFPLVP